MIRTIRLALLGATILYAVPAPVPAMAQSARPCRPTCP
jgi:hypothetical protein